MHRVLNVVIVSFEGHDSQFRMHRYTENVNYNKMDFFRVYRKIMQNQYYQLILICSLLLKVEILLHLKHFETALISLKCNDFFNKSKMFDDFPCRNTLSSEALVRFREFQRAADSLLLIDFLLKKESYFSQTSKINHSM